MSVYLASEPMHALELLKSVQPTAPNHPMVRDSRDIDRRLITYCTAIYMLPHVNPPFPYHPLD